MSDEKDRLGQRLHDIEKAREDQWARDEDKKLIEKLRQRQTHVDLHCPQCNSKLVVHAHNGFAMMSCPSGHGAWLDKVTLEKVVSSRK